MFKSSSLKRRSSGRPESHLKPPKTLTANQQIKTAAVRRERLGAFKERNVTEYTVQTRLFL